MGYGHFINHCDFPVVEFWIKELKLYEFGSPSKKFNGAIYVFFKNGRVYRTFKTVRGYEQFLKTHGIFAIASDWDDKYCGGDCLAFTAYCSFEVVWFHRKEDLPKGLKKFVDLFRGNYVECYYGDFDGQRVIFVPSPNKKEVYKPLDYNKYSKLYG